MRIQPFTCVVLVLLLSVATSCKKGSENEGTADARAASQGLGCDHDVRASSVVKNAWPYPAEQRDLRVTGKYERIQLRLKPNNASFFTATMVWREGDRIEVLDSEIRILKPRRLVAKRDMFVTRKAISQGVEVTEKHLAAAKGEVGEFFFYNSRGLCLIGTDFGPGWTRCTLEDAFEGLSAESPDPCEYQWWVQTQRNRVDKGWMVVDPRIMERVPPPDEAR